MTQTHKLAGSCVSHREVEELRHYSTSRFDLSFWSTLTYPLPDEPFLETWRSYAAEVEKAGTLLAIYRWLPQLQFPIEENLSKLPEYTNATRRGRYRYPSEAARGLPLKRPDLCRIGIHQTAAGRLPIISADVRSDFVALVQAFTKRGEPVSVPNSMGAVMITGYNNFHRIHQLKDAFHAKSNDAKFWMTEFARIKAQKDLYQDKFVILSSGPYSGVPDPSLNQTVDEWLQTSSRIRLAHECAHYFTSRVLGSMQNKLLDELLADFCGIVSATGTYSKEWALCFLGINDEFECRPGGRIENYRGDPPLSSGAFNALKEMVCAAVANLEVFDRASVRDPISFSDQAAAICTIASFTLDNLALPNGGDRLIEKYHTFCLALAEQYRAKPN